MCHWIEELLKENGRTLKKAVKQEDAAKKTNAGAPKNLRGAKPGAREVGEAQMAKRPPVRKYFSTMGKPIRSEDTSIDKHQSGDVTVRTPDGISIASLKEKFGLSEQQVEGIIKEAERHGRIRKHQDGSYVWA
jgi:Mor family transcriptional regulator